MSDFGGAVKKRPDYDFAILGVPYDEKSTYLKGSSAGPRAIREASTEAMINAFTELGVDLQTQAAITDGGDIPVMHEPMNMFASIEESVTKVLKHNAVPIVLGGDHSITYPIVKAMAKHIQPLDILHFDAHPDLYEEYHGDRYSHASPFARILDDGLVSELVQVGIRAATAAHRNKAAKYGIKMLEMKDLPPDVNLKFSNPVYISFDMDALDPAFAPGVSHCEPGGLSTRQVLQILHALKGRIVGMDVVEVNPSRDVSGITASVAAKIVMETIGKIVYDQARSG